jgi:fructose-1,6-bisphosphatase
MITLSEFITKKQNNFPEASGVLTSLLNSILLTTKVVNREIKQVLLTPQEQLALKIFKANNNQNGPVCK